jgi:hypothetical protein
MELSLPAKATFETAVDYQSPSESVPLGCSYAIRGPDHTIAHSAGLLSALKGSLLEGSAPETFNPLGEHKLWLLDSVVSLHIAQTATPHNGSFDFEAMIRIVIDLSKLEMDSKPFAALVFLCSGALEDLQSISKDQDGSLLLRRTVCSAFVLIAKAVLQYRSVAKLALSQLIPSLQTLPADNHVFDPKTDFRVCVQGRADVFKANTSSRHVFICFSKRRVTLVRTASTTR